jgi:hypothetical protein
MCFWSLRKKCHENKKATTEISFFHNSSPSNKSGEILCKMCSAKTTQTRTWHTTRHTECPSLYPRAPCALICPLHSTIKNKYWYLLPSKGKSYTSENNNSHGPQVKTETSSFYPGHVKIKKCSRSISLFPLLKLQFLTRPQYAQKFEFDTGWVGQNITSVSL